MTQLERLTQDNHRLKLKLQARTILLIQATNAIQLYYHLFNGKISKERELKYSNLISQANEELS